MPNALSDLSAQQLRKAASLREKIDTLEKQLASILGQAPAPKPAAGPRAAKPAAKRRRKLSKAARAKLSASAKARWAKVKAAGKKSL
jgi:hypothetical protein